MNYEGLDVSAYIDKYIYWLVEVLLDIPFRCFRKILCNMFALTSRRKFARHGRILVRCRPSSVTLGV